MKIILTVAMVATSVLAMAQSTSIIGGVIGGLTNRINTAITDASLMTMLRERYARDMASGSTAKIAEWHGRLTRQTLDTTNGVMRLVFADGFQFEKPYKRALPHGSNTIEVVRNRDLIRKAYEKQLEQAKKELESYSNGVPQALLLQRIESLKARLNDGTTTNITINVGGAKVVAE